MRRLFHAFTRSEEGSATVESVLWTPIFLLLFGMVTDTSIVFGRQAEILRIIQDSNRSLAVGHFRSVQQAETYISQRVNVYSPNPDVDVTITNGIISTLVSVPAANLTSTGLFDAINTLTITVGASQMSELG
jgi:Flp pilus assembly protein TadG